MKEVYVTIYRHREGTIYVQVNATEEGQLKFLQNLNRDIFWVEAVGLEKVDD